MFPWVFGSKSVANSPFSGSIPSDWSHNETINQCSGRPSTACSFCFNSSGPASFPAAAVATASALDQRPAAPQYDSVWSDCFLMGDDGVCRHPVNVSFIIILVVTVVTVVIIIIIISISISMSMSISISISHHSHHSQRCDDGLYYFWWWWWQ